MTQLVAAWMAHPWALAEVIAVSTATGLVGALALLHRRIFFAEAVSHAAFPGAVAGVVVAATVAPTMMTPLLFAGALTGCLLLALVMHAVACVPGVSSQAAAGIVLSCGFAAGYFLATWFKPLPVRVDSFLTGSVLTANAMDITVATAVAVLALLVWWASAPKLVAVAFDRTSLKSMLVDASVLTLISLAIVAAIPAVGTIVSIALLAAPAASLQHWVRSPAQLFFLSPLLGAAIGIVGLGISIPFGLSTGGTIALLAGCAYGLSLLLRH